MTLLRCERCGLTIRRAAASRDLRYVLSPSCPRCTTDRGRPRGTTAIPAKRPKPAAGASR